MKQTKILLFFLGAIFILFAVGCSKSIASDTNVSNSFAPTIYAQEASEPVDAATERISPQTDLLSEFRGTWKRTNIESAQPSTIIIDNVTYDGFDFSIEALYWSRTGSLRGKALFINENSAVCTIDGYTEIEFKFILQNQTLTIPRFEGESSLPVGVGVSISGEYTKGEPVYTNAENYALLVPNEIIENAIKNMMDYNTYLYFDLAARNGYITKIPIEQYYLYNVQTSTIGGLGFDIIVDGGNKFYLWYGDFGGTVLYTNDEDYSNSKIYNLAIQKLNQPITGVVLPE